MLKDFVLLKTKKLVEAYFYVADNIKENGFDKATKRIDIDENYRLIRTKCRWRIEPNRPEGRFSTELRTTHVECGPYELGELIERFLTLYV